jgi:hypothetical protein
VLRVAAGAASGIDRDGDIVGTPAEALAKWF